MTQLSAADLEAGLAHIRMSPLDGGRLELIVRRPAIGDREVIESGELDLAVGLVGDTWSDRPSSRTSDGTPHPQMQINMMNVRCASLVGVEEERRALAGDQLYVDLDISEENLPPGTLLRLGGAVLVVTAEPHRGCRKFTDRFGIEAHRFVNSPVGQSLRLRGMNARVVQAGTVTKGDIISKVGNETV